MIFALLNAFYFIDKNKKLKLLTNLVIGDIIINNLFVIKNSFLNKKSIPLVRLRANQKIIDYLPIKIYFCLKIYTPPVVTYIYMYLLLHYADLGKIKYQKVEFYKKILFFLINKDEYQFKVNKWRQDNI